MISPTYKSHIGSSGSVRKASLHSVAVGDDATECTVTHCANLGNAVSLSSDTPTTESAMSLLKRIGSSCVIDSCYI